MAETNHACPRITFFLQHEAMNRLCNCGFHSDTVEEHKESCEFRRLVEASSDHRERLATTRDNKAAKAESDAATAKANAAKNVRPAVVPPSK